MKNEEGETFRLGGGYLDSFHCKTMEAIEKKMMEYSNSYEHIKCFISKRNHWNQQDEGKQMEEEKEIFVLWILRVRGGYEDDPSRKAKEKRWRNSSQTLLERSGKQFNELGERKTEFKCIHSVAIEEGSDIEITASTMRGFYKEG